MCVCVYLCVAHASGGEEGLLDSVALGEGSRRLAVRVPVTLHQELEHLQVTPQRGVNQRTLTVPVQMVHLHTHTQ